MGQVSSTNEVKNMTLINMGILNEFAIDCSSTLSQKNIINAQDECSIDITDTDLVNTAYVDKSCLLSASNAAQMSSIAAQQMEQQASAIAQQWGLSSASTSNLINNSYILSQDIVNTYSLDCASDIYQSNSVTCSGGGSITMNGASLENFSDIEADCTQKVLSSSQAASDIETILSQSAKAEQESKFGGLMTAIFGVIAVIVIVLIIVKSSRSSSSSSKAPIGMIVGIFVFLVVAVIVYVSVVSKKGKTKYPSPKTSGTA